MIGRRQELAVTATCAVASVTYGGAVTTWALVLLILPGVLLGCVIGAWLTAQRNVPAALAVGAIAVLVWSEVANILSGQSNGPAARSTFVAAACSLVATVAARSGRPALFLVPLVASIFGALALGAGGEVRLVSVAAAVMAVATLGGLERSKQQWVATPKQRVATVALLVAVGAAAAGAIVLQTTTDLRRPLVLARAQADPSITPGWSDPLGRSAPRSERVRTHPARSGRAATSSPGTAAHVPGSKRWMVLLWVAACTLLALLLAAVARLLAVRISWMRTRRRLGSGSSHAQVAGAWVWARMRLDACRLALPPHVSPDVFLEDGMPGKLPDDLGAPLRTLALSVATAAFSPTTSVTRGDVAAAWRAAERADICARAALGWTARVVSAFRAPGKSTLSSQAATTVL